MLSANLRTPEPSGIAQNEKDHDQGKKNCHDPKNTKCQTKFTNTLNGGSIWGGWTQEGRTRFRTLRAQIAKARQGAHVEALEQAVLNRVR